MFHSIIRVLAIAICSLPLIASAATNQPIHVTWSQYTAPAGYIVSGFKLYQDNQSTCQTQMASATSMDCVVSFPGDTEDFTLTVTFANGTESPKSAPFTFTVTGQSPTAVISSSAAAGQAPLNVTFNASGSASANGTPLASYSWNFGDNFSGSGVSISHTYTTAGTYNATLTVTDNSGLTSSISTPIIVTSNSGNPPPVTPISAERELLWSHVNGSAAIYSLDSSNNKTAEKVYGPYSGWAPVSYSQNSDSTRTLLWSHVNGSAAIYSLDSSNNKTAEKVYGPYSGWTPVSYSQNSNGTRTLLWAHVNGSACIWTLDNSNNLTTYKVYGPYSGWTPVSYSQNSNGTRALLWAHDNGSAGIWTLDSANNLTNNKIHGPYSGWTPVSYSQNSNGTRTLLWAHINGSASIWTLDNSNNRTANKEHGPYNGWAPMYCLAKP